MFWLLSQAWERFYFQEAGISVPFRQFTYKIEVELRKTKDYNCPVIIDSWNSEYLEYTLLESKVKFRYNTNTSAGLKSEPNSMPVSNSKFKFRSKIHMYQIKALLVSCNADSDSHSHSNSNSDPDFMFSSAAASWSRLITDFTITKNVHTNLQIWKIFIESAVRWRCDYEGCRSSWPDPKSHLKISKVNFLGRAGVVVEQSDNKFEVWT